MAEARPQDGGDGHGRPVEGVVAVEHHRAPRRPLLQDQRDNRLELLVATARPVHREVVNHHRYARVTWERNKAIPFAKTLAQTLGPNPPPGEKNTGNGDRGD